MEGWVGTRASLDNLEKLLELSHDSSVLQIIGCSLYYLHYCCFQMEIWFQVSWEVAVWKAVRENSIKNHGEVCYVDVN
jgi:hypothetical protein